MVSETDRKRSLVTGFPGFLASFLVHELLKRDPNIAITFLVEDRFRTKASAQIDAILSEHPGSNASLEVVTGDITRDDLGLGDSYDALTRSVSTVWHLAAIYDLAVDETVAYRINVAGTQNVANFCEACHEFERLNYISTCYVAGTRQGRIFEDELDEGQGFNNHYESTKFWAEVEVQRRMETLPAAIFRPSIVVGDSKTGQTEKYDGPYYLLKAMKRIPAWMPFPRIGAGENVVNIVPIDFAARALAHLGTHPAAAGRVYQIADPNPMKAHEIIDLGLKCLDRSASRGQVPPGVLRTALDNTLIEEWSGIPREVVNYFTHDARYDVEHMESALSETDIHCPHLSTYMQTLVDFYELNPELS